MGKPSWRRWLVHRKLPTSINSLQPPRLLNDHWPSPSRYEAPKGPSDETVARLLTPIAFALSQPDEDGSDDNLLQKNRKKIKLAP
jgi:hypothetical protein